MAVPSKDPKGKHPEDNGSEEHPDSNPLAVVRERVKPLEGNYNRTDDESDTIAFFRQIGLTLSSRHSMAHVDGHIGSYPLPDLYNRLAQKDLEGEDIVKEFAKRTDNLLNQTPLQLCDSDGELDEINQHWVRLDLGRTLLLIHRLFAQRDAAISLSQTLHRVSIDNQLLFRQTLQRVRELEANPDAAKEQQILDLIEARDHLNSLLAEAQEEAIAASREARGLRSKLAQRSDPNHPQASVEDDDHNTQGSRHRSAKIKDPDPLTMDDDLTLRVWRGQMNRKLSGNADWFPTEDHRFAYVTGLVKGTALQHLQTYIDETNEDRFTTVQEVFEYLEDTFKDTMEIQKAEQSLEQLTMSGSDKYQDFASKFILYATQAKEPKSKWKKEFNRRLTYKLQTALARDYINSGIDFEAFRHLGAEMALLHEQQDFARPKKKEKVSTSGTRAGSGAPARGGTPARQGSGTPAPAGGRGATPRLSQEEKNQLMAENKCFYCKEVGHSSRDCTKRMAAEIRRLGTGAPTTAPTPAAAPTPTTPPAPEAEN
jgi:hypothetical protein